VIASKDNMTQEQDKKMTPEEFKQDRVDRFTRTIRARYGLTDEALRLAVSKFVDADELRQKFQDELKDELGLKENRE